MEMSSKDASSIVIWAEELANKYGLGINVIINGFVQANKEVKNIKKAKAFIENEIKSLRDC